MVKKHAGFTLIEVVIFLVVSSIALVGVLALYQQAVARSAEVVVSKQALEAAYALLEEVQAMPFTYCDTSDPVASSAASAAGCTTPQGLTPMAGRTRGSLSNPFSNVGDYGGYTQTGITDINGNAAPGLSGYQVSVGLSNVGVGAVPALDSIKIDVTIKGPLGVQTVSGYRIRHSPNATP